jgi:predicted phage-related endonuclease
MSVVTETGVRKRQDRRAFIGGSDARIIMGSDEAALVRLWHEKRGEVEPEDLSGNLVVQLGLATEELNRRWYEANTGQVVTDVQKQICHPALRWMVATLDGRVESSDAVFEAKFMLPWSFSEEAAAEKYMPQLQHNMWVVAARTAVLSVITGEGSGSRSSPMPIRSISTSSSLPSASSGAVSRAASRLASSVSSRRSPGSRLCESSI